MHRKAFLALLAVLCVSATAYATPTVNATNGGNPWDLQPNKAGQVIDIFVSGGDLVTGVDLALQIGDGSTGPLITSVDLWQAGDLMLFPNNTGSQGEAVLLPDGNSFSGISTSSGSVAATGTLAHITISTVGIFSGSFPVSLFNSVQGLPTDMPPFDDITNAVPFIVDGVLNIVPEPSSVVLGLFAAGGLCAVAIRRRRKVA